MKTQIVLATAEELPRPESESSQIIDALAALGVTAEVVPWTRRRDWSAVPLVVIRSTWDYWNRLDDFLGWVREVGAATRLLNPPAAGGHGWLFRRRPKTQRRHDDLTSRPV